jgi:SNF2 family DNA or RNA helicase
VLTIDLYPYQNGAVDSALEQGTLLVAFEMGTGKSVIALAIMEELIASGDAQTCFVVVPSSLKWQWAQQIARAIDVDTCSKTLTIDGVKQELTVPIDKHAIVIDGSPAKRLNQYAFIKENRPDYIILGYENIVNDWNYVRRIKPDAIFLDEITAIKTFKAQRTRKIKRLTAPYRFGLTGTPVENGKPEELFSIMQWIDSEVLGRFDLFDKTYIVRNRYGGVQRYKNLPVLHAKLAEVMVRKTRRDPEVAKYLPKTQESNLYVDLDPKSRKAYSTLAKELLSELQKSDPGHGAEFDLAAYYNGQSQNENSAQGRIMSRMQALDMLLDHPDLIVASGMDYEESLQQQQAGVERANWPGSKYCYEVWQSGLLDDLTDSPKLAVLTEDVKTVLGSHPDNKIIVFTYFRHALDAIDEALTDLGTVQYHGGLSSAAKAGAVAKFRDDPDTRIFITSHAGAFGTDLYFANYLYNYDLAWSAGTVDQINARHSRAASTFENIYVRNLITRGTTEPRKQALIAHKRRVGSAILDNVGADDKGRVVNEVGSLTEHLLEALNTSK